MTSDQFPPYPGEYTYEPFGAGQSYPGGPVGGKRVPPETVRYAFYAMLAGAALTLISLLYGFTRLGEAREQAASSAKGNFTDSQLDTIVIAGYVVSTVTSLVSIGLWVWMAFASRAGKNWARITGSVLFGLSTLGLVFMVVLAASTSVEEGLGVLNWLVGLAAVILLWVKQSGVYFRPVPAYTPYGPGGYPMNPQGF